MNSGIKALEEVARNVIDLDSTADFVGKEALKRIKADGVKRHLVGLFIKGELPRLEWFWDLRGRNSSSGEVRWAVHSFDLDRSIGIAIVDIAIKFADVVEVTHPWGCAQAEVTALPFTGRAK